MSVKSFVIEGSVRTLGWVSYHAQFPGECSAYWAFSNVTNLPIIGVGEKGFLNIAWYDPALHTDAKVLIQQLTPENEHPLYREGSLPQIHRVLGWLGELENRSVEPSLSWNAYFRVSREIMECIKAEEVARLESLKPPRTIPTQIQPWVPTGEYTATPHVGFKIRDVEKGLITLWLYHTDRAELEKVRQSIESAFGDDHFDFRSSIDAVLNTTNLLVLTLTRKMTPEEIKGNWEAWEKANPLPEKE